MVTPIAPGGAYAINDPSPSHSCFELLWSVRTCWSLAVSTKWCASTELNLRLVVNFEFVLFYALRLWWRGQTKTSGCWRNGDGREDGVGGRLRICGRTDKGKSSGRVGGCAVKDASVSRYTDVFFIMCSHPRAPSREREALPRLSSATVSEAFDLESVQCWRL